MLAEFHGLRAIDLEEVNRHPPGMSTTEQDRGHPIQNDVLQRSFRGLNNRTIRPV